MTSDGRAPRPRSAPRSPSRRNAPDRPTWSGDRIHGVSVRLPALTARTRTRTATDGYARLVEAAVRLRARDLGCQVGLDFEGPLPADAGDRFDEVFASAPPLEPR